MRILIVNRHIDDIAGGSETQCHEIAEALTERGHAVTYAVCRPGDSQRDHAYRIHPLRGRFGAAFRGALRDVRPDIVYWRYNKRHLLRSVLAARRRGVRFVFSVSHINDVRAFTVKPYRGRQGALARRALRAAARLRDSVLGAVNYGGLSFVDAIVFQHAGQIPRGLRTRHEVIYNSAARPPAAPGREPEASLRESSPYVLWVSNLKQSKNPQEFIRLARDLEHTGVGFWMVGGIQDPAYRSLLDNDRLPAGFRYLGLKDRESVADLIGNSLFLAHTCSPEGFPNVFIQSWAAGKAVVSLHFDPGSLLTTHRIGLCSGDYATFVRDVQRLIADAELREEIGRRARLFAAEHCDRATNVARLESLLEDLVVSGRA